MPIKAQTTPITEALRRVAEQQTQSLQAQGPHAIAAPQVTSDIDQAPRRSPALRYQVEVGQLDGHLRLAPCQRIEPQWPAGVRPWGKVRVALRCTQGAVAWKVYLPVTVRAWGRAMVATSALPAGTILQAHHLSEGELDFAASAEWPLDDASAMIGRITARAVVAGQPLRAADVQLRQWFGIGDTVRIHAIGADYQVSGEGVAVTVGIEGRSSRVKTSSGRIVTGRTAGERLINVSL